LPCPYRDTAVTLYVRGSDAERLAEYRRDTGGVGVGSGLHATYICAGDQRIAMPDASGRLLFYLNDHLGSAQAVIDSTGAVKDKYRYWAFGAPRSQQVNLDQKYRYAGKPFDEDDGIDLHYYGARYYEPDLGRFLAIDPVASKYPGWSPYV